MKALRELCSADYRICVLEESERRGKAEAVNRIFAATTAGLMVMVNSDAVPQPGSLKALVESMAEDPRAGVISASPFIEGGGGMSELLLRLMWCVHNATLLRLNHEGKSNHSSDEMMAVRRTAFSVLPSGTVNDGAFLAGMARLKGYSVKFLDTAPVKIDGRRNLPDILRQLRRIVFGHLQVMSRTGSAPRTAGSMIFLSPLTSLRLVVDSLAKEPKMCLALPAAAVTALAIAPAALFDAAVGTTRHEVWRRNEGAA